MAVPETASDQGVTGAREMLANATPDRRGRRDTGAALVFLAPWLLGIVLLTALPMIASAVLSFTNYDLLSWPRFIGTANYERLVVDPRYLQSLRVTTTYV
ncbi:MAG: sugar ABC transporter permease, partial [Devosia nanyangense]|nr:sugar ABC transporter permease [Devosia nanyangense]